jgi:hypothetical protein
MDTLQIQDTFEPYFADRTTERASAPSRVRETAAANVNDIRDRLSACRDRLAAAIERRAARH